MLTRRRFLQYSALTPGLMAYRPLLRARMAQSPAGSVPRLRLAIIGNTYHLGSGLQTLADRFLVGYPYNGTWHIPNVQVVSMYIQPLAEQTGVPAPDEPVPMEVPSSSSEPSGAGGRGAGGRGAGGREAAGVGATGDRRPPVAQSAQRPRPAGAQQAAELAAPGPATGPEADLSVGRAQEFGFRRCRNIPEALRCGGDRLAVDAVLAVVEQGHYPRNDRGQILYPRYDFFQQCAQVFAEEGQAVPYFNYGSLSFSFREAQKMVETAERLKFPLLAGSSFPVIWRLPDIDIPMGAAVQEAVMVGNGLFDSTDFDALEAMQCMLERRKGGETGVKTVQLLQGDDVWAAGDSGRWSKELLSAAQSRSDGELGLTVLDGRTQDMVASGVLPQLAKDPAAYCVEYNDGTRATLLMLDGADRGFTFSARVGGERLISTQFFRTPFPNMTYSACLAAKIEQMYMSRSAPYPVRRTLLTGGILEAGLTSRARSNQRLETPQLAVSYQPPNDSQYCRT